MPLFRKDKPEPEPAPGDAQVLEQLRTAGVDLKAPLDIRHSLHFKQEGDARRLALEFGDSREWQVEVRRAAEGPEWLFLLTHRAVIDLKVIQGIRRSLTEMATRTGGRYDGWEASVPS
ncbi:MAG TPA: ribonuclease E inhibitor RraB [Candidatus Limnocylindria bacterium]